MKKEEITVYGNVKWFEVADQPADFSEIPAEFKKAHELWIEDSEGNLENIIGLLAPFVEAFFLPENLASWDKIFADPSGVGSPEHKAFAVMVKGIDFKYSPIPLCKAEALFKVEINLGYRMVSDIEEWQRNNGFFTGCLTFRWNIPLTKKTDGLDFSQGGHAGCECVPDFAYIASDWLPYDNQTS